MHRQVPPVAGRRHERGRLDQRGVDGQPAFGAAVRGKRAWVQPDLVGYGDERQLDELAEYPQQHLVAGSPPHARLLAHRGSKRPAAIQRCAPTIGRKS